MNNAINSRSDSTLSSELAARVVVVDNEEIVTKNLESILELETDFETLVFQSGAEALQQLNA